MVWRPFNIITCNIITGMICTLSMVMMGNRKAMAAPSPAGSVMISGPGYGSLLVVFCFLSISLVFWMAWSRRRIQKALAQSQTENRQQALLLAARQEVSVVWDHKGQIGSLDDVMEWFGLPVTENMILADICAEDQALNAQQFSCLSDHIDRLLTAGAGFRASFFLGNQHKNIIVRGAPLGSNQTAPGAVVWFRDATVEEDIMLFQEKEITQRSHWLTLFQTLNDLIGLPLWIRDESLRLIWVNKAYVDAVDGENAEQVIAEGRALVASPEGALSRDLHDRYREKHFVVIKGERRAVEVYNFPVEIDKDQPGAIGYAQDITDLDKARGELIHHTESHSETLNKLSTAVAIFSAGKRLEYYNSAFVRLWGLPESLLFSHPHHGELLEALREARRLPEQANFPQWKGEQLAAYTTLMEPVEEIWHLPDNTALRVYTQPHPLGGLLIFYEDVTDHFALERSYNTLYAVQRETLDNLHEAVAVFGIDGCLKLYNEAFADMWQLDRGMLDMSPHAMDVVKVWAQKFGNSAETAALKNLILAGEAKKELAAGRLSRKDGSVLSYSAVTLPDGAMLVTFIDVTDSFAIERVLRQKNQALEEADKIKTDFLAHMSYELRTPMNSIIGFAELLEKEYQGPLNEDQHDYMHSILAASRQLLELFNDILDLSVIEAGGVTFDITQFELPALLHQVTEQLQERIRGKDITLNVTGLDNLVPVSGDAKHIQHIIYNLLSNAVKFTPPMGLVTVGVAQDDRNYTISIQDNGVGIKPDEVGRVCEKFFTGSNVQNEQGAGLGLSLVESFVDLHGGKLDIQSTLDVGTRVILTLPLKIGMAANKPIRNRK